MVRITDLDRSDAQALSELRRLIREYEDSLPRDLRIRDVESELRTLSDRYPSPSAALLLAYDESKAVGCVVVCPLDEATAEIKRLYVVPAARRSGAGRVLMEAAIAFARARRHSRVVLDTERERLRNAYRLYLSLGFAACEPYGTAEYANPTFMELRITPAT